MDVWCLLDCYLVTCLMWICLFCFFGVGFALNGGFGIVIRLFGVVGGLVIICLGCLVVCFMVWVALYCDYRMHLVITGLVVVLFWLLVFVWCLLW